MEVHEAFTTEEFVGAVGMTTYLQWYRLMMRRVTRQDCVGVYPTTAPSRAALQHYLLYRQEMSGSLAVFQEPEDHWVATFLSHNNTLEGATLHTVYNPPVPGKYDFVFAFSEPPVRTTSSNAFDLFVANVEDPADWVVNLTTNHDYKTFHFADMPLHAWMLLDGKRSDPVEESLATRLKRPAVHSTALTAMYYPNDDRVALGLPRALRHTHSAVVRPGVTLKRILGRVTYWHATVRQLSPSRTTTALVTRVFLAEAQRRLAMGMGTPPASENLLVVWRRLLSHPPPDLPVVDADEVDARLNLHHQDITVPYIEYGQRGGVVVDEDDATKVTLTLAPVNDDLRLLLGRGKWLDATNPLVVQSHAMLQLLELAESTVVDRAVPMLVFYRVLEQVLGAWTVHGVLSSLPLDLLDTALEIHSVINPLNSAHVAALETCQPLDGAIYIVTLFDGAALDSWAYYVSFLSKTYPRARFIVLGCGEHWRHARALPRFAWAETDVYMAVFGPDPLLVDGVLAAMSDLVGTDFNTGHYTQVLLRKREEYVGLPPHRPENTPWAHMFRHGWSSLR